MECLRYVGTDGDTIIIEKPTDLYPMLDWIQSRMMDFVNDEDENKAEFER